VVKTIPDFATQAAAILNTHGAVNVDDGVQAYRDSGFNRFDESLQPLTIEEIAANRQMLTALSGKRQLDGTNARIYDEIGVDYSIPTIDTRANTANGELRKLPITETQREHALQN